MNCGQNPSECAKTEKYIRTGSQISYICGSPYGPAIRLAISKAIRGWYNQYQNVSSLQEVNSSSGGDETVAFSAWAQLVQSKADRMGCSVIRLPKTHWECAVISCVYGAGNLKTYPVFTFGEPASLCKTGENSIYPGLCSPNEDFSQQENGEIYFGDNNAPESPVVKQWLENGKKLNN